MSAVATETLEVRADRLLPLDRITQEGFIPLTVLSTAKRPCEMVSVHYESAVAPGWRQYHRSTLLMVERPGYTEPEETY